jgi:general secretion pathway protein B
VTDKSTDNSITEVVEFHDLPESIKLQLPAIIISAHVYSSNPAQRSVVINNNFMEEREYVIDDLILHEITPDGAIFNYQGTLFNLGVVSGWQ